MPDKQQKLNGLRKKLEILYQQKAKYLPFHGWHHMKFVSTKAVEFAKSIDADLFIVESAALTHDLNHIIKANSRPEIAAQMRRDILTHLEYEDNEITQIEQVILEAHTEYRTNELSDEAKALSDGDALFKALPITPIIFAHKYLYENGISIDKLAQNVVKDQVPLMNTGIYFYTLLAKEKYLKWAQTNLDLWINVVESLADENVQDLLHIEKSIDM